MVGGTGLRHEMVGGGAGRRHDVRRYGRPRLFHMVVRFAAHVITARRDRRYIQIRQFHSSLEESLEVSEVLQLGGLDFLHQLQLSHALFVSGRSPQSVEHVVDFRRPLLKRWW